MKAPRIQIVLPPPMKMASSGEEEKNIQSSTVESSDSNSTEAPLPKTPTPVSVRVPKCESCTVSTNPQGDNPSSEGNSSNTKTEELSDAGKTIELKFIRNVSLVVVAVGLLCVIASRLTTGIAPDYDIASQQLPQCPSADFHLLTETDSIFESPDRKMQVEQYYKDSDNGRLYRFWVFDKSRKHNSLLNHSEIGIEAEYGAGFRFTPDSQWIVRMQKTGSGNSTVFLYRKMGLYFIPATSKPLGDLVWDYFGNHPDSKLISQPTYHRQAYLIKGLEENYKWLNLGFPNSRYLVLGIFGEILEGGQKTVVDGWRCVYDLQEGEFSVPSAFDENNRASLKRQPQVKEAIRAKMTAEESEELLNLAYAYVSAASKNDPNQMAALYAQKVNCFDAGILTPSQIWADANTYQKRWPLREYWFINPPHFIDFEEASENAWIQLDLGYKVSNGKRDLNGTTTIVIGVFPGIHPPKISAIRETVTSQKSK